jgi:hypothetical protein
MVVINTITQGSKNMVNLFDVLKNANPKNGTKPTAKNPTPQKKQGKAPVVAAKPMRKAAGRGR